MARLENFIVGGLISTGIILAFSLMITSAEFSYSVTKDTSKLDSFNKTQELLEDAEDLKNAVTIDSDVSTLESVASFFSATFTGGKLLFNTIGVLEQMINSAFGDVLIFPGFVLLIVMGSFFAIVTFAIMRFITGRFG